MDAVTEIPGNTEIGFIDIVDILGGGGGVQNVRDQAPDTQLDEESIRDIIIISHTPKQTPHFNTKSEINPSRTLVKNEIMKTFKSAQNIVNRARKCIWHCFSCEMGQR